MYRSILVCIYICITCIHVSSVITNYWSFVGMLSLNVYSCCITLPEFLPIHIIRSNRFLPNS